MGGVSRRIARGIGLCALVAGLLGAAATVGQAHLRGAAAPAEAGLFGLYARLSLELESRLGTDVPAEETRIVLGPGGRDVRLAGALTEGAAARLERLLAENPGVARIHLTSEGGLVDEGQGLGAAIAARGLSTYVPDYCVSACTLAFVRGRERYVTPVSRLGFHAPYEPGLFGQAFQVDAVPERAAYLAAGVAADFVDEALKVASEDIWIPQTDRLLAAGVATAVVDTRRFPDSTLDDGDDAERAREAVLRNFAVLRGFEGRAPRVVDGLVAWYRDGYHAGLSEGEAVEGLRRLAARSIGRVLRRTDARSLVAAGHYLLRAMERADPAACAAIGADADLVLAEEVLEAGRQERRTGREEGAARALLARALAGAPPAAAPDPGSLAQEALWPMSAPPASACAGLRAAYAAALARPRPEAAAALRALLPPAAPRPALEASAQP